MAFAAEVVLDSINPDRQRLCSVLATYPRFIHAEIMTHRDRARNAASSRAIPWKAKRKRHGGESEAEYAANMAECDDAIGVVMDKLRALKLEDDTLILLTSDNGGSSPFADVGGLRGKKWVLWEKWNTQDQAPRWTDRRWDGEEARKKMKDKEPQP